jgi:hypothetical protein
MEKQHPLWNYNYFNRRKAVHAYPPSSEFHIPSTTPYRNEGYRKNDWNKKKHYQEDMLFAEDMED